MCQTLSELMMDYGVGVTRQAAYKLKRIDSDYLCPFGEGVWYRKRSAGSEWLKSRIGAEWTPNLQRCRGVTKNK